MCDTHTLICLAHVEEKHGNNNNENIGQNNELNTEGNEVIKMDTINNITVPIRWALWIQLNSIHLDCYCIETCYSKFNKSITNCDGMHGQAGHNGSEREREREWDKKR